MVDGNSIDRVSLHSPSMGYLDEVGSLEKEKIAMLERVPPENGADQIHAKKKKARNKNSEPESEANSGGKKRNIFHWE